MTPERLNSHVLAPSMDATALLIKQRHAINNDTPQIDSLAECMVLADHIVSEVQRLATLAEQLMDVVRACVQQVEHTNREVAARTRAISGDTDRAITAGRHAQRNGGGMSAVKSSGLMREALRHDERTAALMLASLFSRATPDQVEAGMARMGAKQREAVAAAYEAWNALGAKS